jgi:hypothetical protein
MTTDDSHSDTRSRTTLVANGPFRVETCGCGTLHISIGAVTIRLPPSAFESLATTLMQAADQLSDPGTATRH